MNFKAFAAGPVTGQRFDRPAMPAWWPTLTRKSGQPPFQRQTVSIAASILSSIFVEVSATLLPSFFALPDT